MILLTVKSMADTRSFNTQGNYCSYMHDHFWILSCLAMPSARLHSCMWYVPSMVVFWKVASSSSSLLVLSCCCSILYWIFSSLSRTVSSRRAVSKRISHHSYHQCPVFITDFLTWVFQQEPLENVNGGILPGSLSTAAVCATTLSNSALLTHCCSAV